MIQAVIKGPAKSAKRSAARRGIPLRACKTFGNRSDVGCAIPCNAAKKVQAWFSEKSGSTRVGRGFAPGTILFFNNKCSR